MKLRLRHKVIGLALGSALFPAIALSVFVGIQEGRSSNQVQAELGKIVSKSLSDTTEEVYGLCLTANDLVQKHVNATLHVARYLFEQAGPVSFGPEEVPWQARNQYTGEVIEIMLPEMKVGGVWLGQNFNSGEKTPVVDQVRELVGGTATIFQRMNESGDMLRVATNVSKLDGNRAIGTFIPAVNPNGEPNPVIQTVVDQRETYRGPAFVVNDWYLTAYQPIMGEGNYVEGILYVGVRRESVATLRRALDSLDIGEHGFVWIMYGADSKRAGQFEYTSPGRFPYTGDTSTITDVNDEHYFEKIRQDAIKLDGGEVASRVASWADPTDPSHIHTTEIHYTYFPEWDWVIGVTAFEEDYAEPRRAISNVFSQILMGTTIGGLIVVIAVAFIATYLGGLIAQPISFLTGVAAKVAEGDLGGAMSLARGGLCNKRSASEELSKAKDETGDLYRAIMAMIENLRRLVGEVKQSSTELMGSASEISGTARLQEGTVQDFGASSSEIAAAVKEISTTAKELTGTMSNVSESARRTGEAAGDSRSSLGEMREGAEELAVATTSISDKLSVITERAGNISSIVTTIAKVADQTNLLSLNAAIEAEKAGEFGLGFAVVAREIRRLADQTAVATLDIEQMVREMQSSVNAGVMEMDKFHQAVRGSVDDITRLGGQMEQIIQQVQSLTPRFEAVTEGMEAQATGADQISDAITQLNGAAQQTSASLQNFKSATEKLDRAVRNLDEGVSRFRMEEGEAVEDATKPDVEDEA